MPSAAWEHKPGVSGRAAQDIQDIFVATVTAKPMAAMGKPKRAVNISALTAGPPVA
jgi:hypothetical protein